MSCSCSVAQSVEAENDHEGEITFSFMYWSHWSRCVNGHLNPPVFFFFWSYVQLLWKIWKRLCAAHRWTKWVKSVMGALMKAVNSCLNPVCTITTLQTVLLPPLSQVWDYKLWFWMAASAELMLHILMVNTSVHIPLHTLLFSTEKNGVTTRRNRRRGKDWRASSAVTALRIKCLSDLWMIQKIEDTSVIRWY